MELWEFRVLICIRRKQSGTREEDFCLCQLPSCSERTLSLPTKDCVSSAETPKMSPWSTAEQTSAGRADRQKVEHRKSTRSRALLSCWREAWPQGSGMAVLRSQPRYIIIELFHSHAVLTAVLCHDWTVCIEYIFLLQCTSNCRFLLVENIRQWLWWTLP